MRKIRRNRNKKHTVLVRKIRNLFDIALYRHQWQYVDIFDSQCEVADVRDYLDFVGKVMHKGWVSYRVGQNTFAFDVEPLAFCVKPYALRDDNAVLHYAVRIKDERILIGNTFRYKGDIVYVDIDDEGSVDVMVCHGCGLPIVGDEWIETSDTNHVYCTHCQDRYYYQCEVCDEYFDDEYITASNDDERHVCNGCYEDGQADDWFYCEECEEYCAGDSWYVHDGMGNEITVCEDCLNNSYNRCDDCDEWYHENTLHEVGDRLVCDDCLSENYTQCERCGEYFTEDYIHYDSEDGCYYCEDCWDNRTDDDDYNEDEGIRSYHDCRGGGGWDSNVGTYGMEYLLVATREENPMLGVELEIDEGGHSNEKARQIRTAIGWDYIICSSDSTLNHGFELVSCPADLQSHMNKLDWKSGVEKAVALGYKSHNAGTCGLHTHIDRGFFEGEDSQVTDSKFVVSLQNNLWWMKKFSRRDDRGGRWRWCSPNPQRYLDECDKMDKESVKNKEFVEEMKNKSAYSHNLALNFDHGNTVEVRFYRGTLKYNSFLAALQCSDIWARLLKGISVEDASEIELKDFIRIATEKEYTAFLTYLAERDITPNYEPKRRVVRYKNTDEYHYVDYPF